MFSSVLEKKGCPLPSVSIIAAQDNNPYRVLVSTIISLRTKDAVTLSSSVRLLEAAPNPSSLMSLSADEISNLIKPAGFYKTKGESLKKIAKILVEKYDSKVPGNMEDLLSLPGVGIKTAALVLNLSYGIDALCVDCHVHEIANRMGWVLTKKPEETVTELGKILPEDLRITINELLVRYGQHICLPVLPRCGECPAESFCPKNGVGKTR